jgi:hypothetical protein
MKHLKTFLTAPLAALLLLSSCGKDSPPNQPAESKFTWTYNGTNYVAKQHAADTSGIGAPSIVAGMQVSPFVGPTGMRIKLSGLQQGTYTITSNGANRFEYIDDAGYVEIGTSGSLNITKNTGTLLSGNFSVTLINTKTITGEFVNTTIKP